MAPSHVGFRDHVNAERHGTLFEAHDAGQRPSSDVIEACAAAGGNVPHLVSETSLSHEGGDRASLSLDDGGPKNNQHALKEVDAAAVAVTETPEQVVHILRYVLEGTLP